MTIELNTAPRKCGAIIRGAAYGGAEQQEDGVLRSAWIVGEMWEGAESPCIPVGEELPFRTQIEISPRLTLSQGRIVSDMAWTHQAYKLTSIAQWGLADHVGETHYKTPYSFAEEAIERGPNRRVTQANAKLWAKHVPFPVLFAHNKMPVFKSQLQAERFLAWAAANTPAPCASLINRSVCGYADRTVVTDGIGETESVVAWEELLIDETPSLIWKPTWESEFFGMSYQSHTGNIHPGVAVLAALDAVKRKDIPEDLRPDFDRALFLASWFTYLCVAVEGESEFDDDLSRYGIEAGVMTAPTP